MFAQTNTGYAGSRATRQAAGATYASLLLQHSMPLVSLFLYHALLQGLKALAFTSRDQMGWAFFI